MKSYSFKRRVFSFILYAFGISWLFLKLNKKNKSIHVYGHRVLEKKSKINKFFINTGHAISLNNFKKKIKLLKNNFSIISINELSNKKNNNNYSTISFDDGYKDNISIAFPILEKYNIPMHVFITSDIIEHKLLFWPDILGYICCEIKGEYKFDFSEEIYLFDIKNRIKSYLSICAILKEYDNNQIYNIINTIIKQTKFDLKINPADIYLSRDDIKNSSHLVTFGGHSVKHENLICLNNKDLKNTIFKSIDYASELSNSNIKTFAYPYGIYDSSIVECLKQNNLCDYAFTTKQDSGKSNFEISRINLNITPYYVFHVEISGAFNWFKKVLV